MTGGAATSFKVPHRQIEKMPEFKVGEIFAAAGTAFSRLGELTMQLHPIDEPAPASGKWTAAEIEMLRIAVKKFSEDMNRISDIIKTRSISQMKNQMKRKAYEEAGISAVAESTSPRPVSAGKEHKPATDTKIKSPGLTKKHKAGGDLTLTSLNASECEVDIETIGEQTSKKVKLEFDSDLEPHNL